MNGYLKFGSQVLATVLAAIVGMTVGDGVVDAGEWINVVIIGLGAVGVLGAGNLPAGVWKYTKFILSIASAVASLLVTYYTDGIDATEAIQLVIAGLGAVGVVALPGPYVEAVGRHAAV